jgi:hypothetical protein
MLGVRVAHNITYLTKHDDNQFISEHATIMRRTLDCNNELRRLGLVGGAYGSGPLDVSTRRFILKTLEKSHAIY